LTPMRSATKNALLHVGQCLMPTLRALYFACFGAQKRHQCSRVGGHFFPQQLLTGGRVFRSRRRDSEIALFESASIALHAALTLSLFLFGFLSAGRAAQ